MSLEKKINERVAHFIAAAYLKGKNEKVVKYNTIEFTIEQIAEDATQAILEAFKNHIDASKPEKLGPMELDWQQHGANGYNAGLTHPNPPEEIKRLITKARYGEHLALDRYFRMATDPLKEIEEWHDERMAELLKERQ